MKLETLVRELEHQLVFSMTLEARDEVGSKTVALPRSSLPLRLEGPASQRPETTGNPKRETEQ